MLRVALVSTVVPSWLRQLMKLKNMVSLPPLSTPPQKIRLQLYFELKMVWKHWKYLCMKIPVLEQEVLLAALKVWKKTDLELGLVARFQLFPTTISQTEFMVSVDRAMLVVEYVIVRLQLDPLALVLLMGTRVASAWKRERFDVQGDVVDVNIMQLQLEPYPNKSHDPLVSFLAVLSLQQKVTLLFALRYALWMVRLQYPLLQVISISHVSSSHILSAEQSTELPCARRRAATTIASIFQLIFNLINQIIPLLSYFTQFMHFTDKQKKSKIYVANGQSIAMNNDHQHHKITEDKVEETKRVQQKKQIDKILQSIVKQRLFGSLLEDNNKLSLQNVINIDLIHRANFKTGNKTSRSNAYQYDLSSRRASLSHHYTLDVSRSCIDKHNQDFVRERPRRRNYSQKLPMLFKKDKGKHETNNLKGPIFHSKKLQVNEKQLSETFKKWAGGITSSQTIYDIKVTQQKIITKFKNVVDGKLIERFFHFFSFPQSFGLRQFSNLLENAANCNLKFIDFWVFSLLDEVNNGILTSQDLFKFLQKFPTENPYIEKQVFQIERYLQKLEKSTKKQQKDTQILVEEMLVINHNLRLEELIVLLKQSNKEIIDVDCLKNTCYHQTLLSLDHDPLERIKKTQIQSSQLQTKRLKMQALEAKKRLKNLTGLRLRDFYVIYGTKRPRIFCFFLNLLAGVKPNQFE